MEQASGGAGKEEESADMDVSVSVEDFLASGRTGRRNAMPDILNAQHAGVGTGGLAEGMEKLNCSANDSNSDSAKNTQNPSTSQGS